MDDPISRQAALEAIKHAELGKEYEAVEALPTIEERKTGRWIDCTSSEHLQCSECGDRAPIYWDANRQEYDEWFSPYCPNCGADMRGEERETSNNI